MLSNLKKDKLINSICVLLLLAVLYGLLGPLELYASSYFDFNFSLWTVLAVTGSATLVGLIVGTLILYLLPDRISKLLRKTVLIVGVVSYIQYLFLNRQLARDDGNYMDWDAMKSTIIINTAIWIVLVSVMVLILIKLKNRWEQIGNYVSIFLIIIQIVAIVSILITTPKGSNDTYHLSAKNEYTVASDGNIIILILDSYGNKQLDATVRQNPGLLDSLKDFTYYSNCDSQYDRTYPTVTSMITGIPFDFDSDNPKRYTTKAWTSDKANSFFDVLNKEGWGFEVYAVNSGCNYGDLECNQDKINNAVFVEGEIHWKRVLVHFTKASIYKMAPYIIKPLFEEITENYRDINTYPDSFDDHLPHLTRVLNEEGIRVLDEQNKRITILHTFGAHDAKTPADIEEVHKYVDLYLDNLKQIGKYEDATIIITADHGMMWSFEGSDPQPIFFIKRPGECSDKVRISNAPISEGDFQGTIMELIGVDTEEFGTSIFDWKDNETRERTVYFNNSENTYYGYTYYKDREELLEKYQREPSVIATYEND